MNVLSSIPWEMASITAPQRETSKLERTARKWKFCKVTRGGTFIPHTVNFILEKGQQKKKKNVGDKVKVAP